MAKVPDEQQALVEVSCIVDIKKLNDVVQIFQELARELTKADAYEVSVSLSPTRDGTIAAMQRRERHEQFKRLFREEG
jgi:hypothetical protein